MIVTSTTNQFQQFSTATREPATKNSKYSLSIVGIASNLSKIAIPVIAILALSNFPVADGGPLSYAACILTCTGTGPGAPLCWTLCGPILFLPGP